MLSQLGDKCLSHTVDFDRGRATFELVNSTVIHIRYNNHGQYSYVILFSSKKLDRIRYDNYDEDWDVVTKPHHQHARNSENVTESSTNGDPETDSTVIIDALKTHTKLY